MHGSILIGYVSGLSELPSCCFSRDLLQQKSDEIGAGSNGSMQLMETEFSKTLGEMVTLHLHHQKSIPAFLSAVTLDLFSRQTTF
ncbi:hypothetical protein GOODEAATRI_009709 [Goodea atripinnis]|uniref:Uncharacterized protein n=1 Tax=Goodea atripinnis TaxID=208336 RepID=A0ABV0N012_9TELE